MFRKFSTNTVFPLSAPTRRWHRRTVSQRGSLEEKLVKEIRHATRNQCWGVRCVRGAGIVGGREDCSLLRACPRRGTGGRRQLRRRQWQPDRRPPYLHA